MPSLLLLNRVGLLDVRAGRLLPNMCVVVRDGFIERVQPAGLEPPEVQAEGGAARAGWPYPYAWPH